MRCESVLQEVYDSWEWKLREKLTDANDVIRRIYFETMQNGKTKPEEYEVFMRKKLSDMLREIGDVKR